MPPRLQALLTLMIVVCAAAPASAQKSTYTLTATGHTGKKIGSSTFTQTLRNRRTGQIIWVRHFPGEDSITWSKDRRAVAFQTGATKMEMPRHQYDIKLVLWRAGSSVQSFFPQPFIHADYVEDMFWSADKKHILFRTGSSGEGDAGHGTLWCMNVATQRVLKVASVVARVRWTSKTRVEYWKTRLISGPGGSYHYQEYPQPRLWHLPGGF